MASHPTAATAGKAHRCFLIHLAAYAAVNTTLAGVNLLTTPDRLWFYWPLAGWGVGLLAHGLATFLPPLLRSGSKGRE